MVSLRPATSADQKRITALIHEAGINPMDLKWPNFVLAVDEATGEIVGVGQIKTHRDSSRELASIAVTPAYQRRGIARQIIEYLLAQNSGTLYLTCRSGLGTFYEPFGFRAVGVEEMSPYFRRIQRLSAVLLRLARSDETMLVMKRE